MRLIIDNRTDKSDIEVMAMINSVVLSGKISQGPKGKQYCYLTTFKNGVVVSCTRNKCSFRFLVYEI